MVPGAFLRYGIELDTSKTYAFASHPHQIKGCDDYEQLRGPEWGEKFLQASLDDAIIVASAQFVLKEATHVEQITTGKGGTCDFFNENTARAWLLELHNNRPTYVDEAVQTAVAHGANNAKDREAFLDILANAIADSYIPEGVAHYRAAKAKAKTPLTPEQDAKLLADSKHNAREKGVHITQRISRHLVVPELAPSVAKDDTKESHDSHGAPAAPAPAPTPVAKAPATQDHQASVSYTPTRTEPHQPEHAEQHVAPTSAPGPAPAAAAVAPDASTDAIDGEYALVLGQVKSGVMGVEQASTQLVEFDKVMHNGMPSPKGQQLVAKLHAEVAAQHPAAAAPVVAAKPAPAHVEPTATPAPADKDEKPLPKVDLAASSKKLIDDIRALNSETSGATADLLDKVDTEVSLLSKHTDEKEYGKTKDTNRDKLVATIGELRRSVDTLRAPHLNPEALAALKARVYLHIQDVSPYFSQYRNVDILEQFYGEKNKDTATRTCNITSLSMALESLGATPSTYDSARMPIIARVASYFNDETNRAANIPVGKDGKHTQAGQGKALPDADLHIGAGLTGLRMPDFVELAAIAEHCTESSSDSEINAARWKAWDEILGIFNLETIAKRFHVKTDTKALSIGGHSAGNQLFDFGGANTGKGENNRMNTEHLVDTRNNLETLKAAGKSETDKDYIKAKAAYDKALAVDKDALDGKVKNTKGKDVEAPELAAYKQAVMEQVGKPFEQGRAVVIGLFGHFTRLQGMTDEELIIGDPAMWTTGQHRKVLWNEARAMGYFHHFLLLG